MEEKTLEGFEKAIEKEIETLEDCILNGVWNETNYQSLLNNTDRLKKLKATIIYIKQYRRDLI